MADIFHGNSKEKLKDFDNNTFHSVVTDPPYELGFMNREWDSSGIAFDREFWEEVFRVLKPGGHVLSFGGSRTHHRVMVAIEDAGFEIRDCIMWIYCSGFPKSHNVDRAIDKEMGTEDDREVVATEERYNEPSGLVQAGRGKESREKIEREITKPSSDEAKEWEEWGTALKPAHEPIVVARKPLSEKNIAQNVLKHGTGAINIRECKIGDEVMPAVERGGSVNTDFQSGGKTEEREGRWPTNVIFDEKAGEMLDQQSRGKDASKFFYCPKPHPNEKNIGCKDNYHPTVKPIELMAYLTRLVTPKSGKVLDPFLGSGTTCIAAVLEQVESVGIEMDEEKTELARKRVEYVKNNYQKVYEMIFDEPSNDITKKEKSTIDHSFWN